MPTQITVQFDAYTFEELSDAAKDVARQWYAEHLTYFEWYDLTYQEWQEALGELGYSDVKIFFSGFYCQGDGACFEADVNLPEWYEATGYDPRMQAAIDEIEKHGLSYVATLKQSSHYYHEMSVSIDYEDRFGFENHESLDALLQSVLEYSRGKMKEIYRGLRDEYEGLLSDEAIADAAHANGWKFDVNGKYLPYG